jgi:hypothetical protein
MYVYINIYNMYTIYNIYIYHHHQRCIILELVWMLFRLRRSLKPTLIRGQVTHIYVYVYIQICIYIFIYIYIYIYIYLYIYRSLKPTLIKGAGNLHIYIYIYIYMYIYKKTRLSVSFTYIENRFKPLVVISV